MHHAQTQADTAALAARQETQLLLPQVNQAAAQGAALRPDLVWARCGSNPPLGFIPPGRGRPRPTSLR